MSPPPKLSRRGFTFGAAALAGVAVVAGAVYEIPKLLKRRAHGQHAALVNRLADPEQAAIVGRAVHLDAGEEAIASELKKRFAKNDLAELAAEDSKDIARTEEAGGWVLPLAVAQLCTLAAQAV